MQSPVLTIVLMLRFCCKLNIKISRSNHLNVEIKFSLSHFTELVTRLSLFGILDAALISTQPYHYHAFVWILPLFSKDYSWFSIGVIPSQRLFTYLNGRSVVFENGSAHIHNWQQQSQCRSRLGWEWLCALNFVESRWPRVRYNQNESDYI